MEDEVSRTKQRFARMLRWQTGLVAVWMWFAVFVEESESIVVLMALFGVAGVTLATGRYVLVCPKNRLNVAHQTYALLCTILGFSVLFVVGMPSMKIVMNVENNEAGHTTLLNKDVEKITNKALLGTLLSLLLVCVSVAATTCVVNYSEAVNPLKPKDD